MPDSNRIYYPLEGKNLWEGMTVHEVSVNEILPQADPQALTRLEAMNSSDPWTKHLLSLEKYKEEVVKDGWRNPIIIWQGTEKDFEECPSRLARKEGHKYIIAVGYNRHYWSMQWGLETIKAVICFDPQGAHALRSLSEVSKKIEVFGIERVKGNLIIPMHLMIDSGLLLHGRFPQWIFPRFKIDPSRIVERIKGKDWKELKGSHRVIRPMPGRRNHQSKFYQIAGDPPVEGEEFIAIIHPEGWISIDGDFERYMEIFQKL